MRFPRRLMASLATLVLFTVVALGASLTPASADPAGGYGAAGPQTAQGADQFAACHWFNDATQAWAAYASVNTNWIDYLFEVAMYNSYNGFEAAYYAGGQDNTDLDGWSYAESIYLDFTRTANFGDSYEQNIAIHYLAPLCSPITSIEGNPGYWVNVANSWENGGGHTPVYWNPCQGISLNGDAWVTSHVNLTQIAAILSLLTGDFVAYTPTAGTNVDYYISSASSLGTFGGLPVDGYTQNYEEDYNGGPFSLTFAQSWILNSLSNPHLQEVVLHEAGLAMGLGEPSNGGPGSGVIEEMQTEWNGSTSFYQAGDWVSGEQNGVLHASCSTPPGSPQPLTGPPSGAHAQGADLSMRTLTSR